jgi:hypothetical protein
VIVYCGAEEGTREDGGKQFESGSTQVCIFRQKNCTSVAKGVVAGWWRYFFLFYFFIFDFFSDFFSIFWTLICSGGSCHDPPLEIDFYGRTHYPSLRIAIFS